jgi:hypothetical protein
LLPSPPLLTGDLVVSFPDEAPKRLKDANQVT